MVSTIWYTSSNSILYKKRTVWENEMHTEIKKAMLIWLVVQKRDKFAQKSEVYENKII